jgi:quinol monooxygenase YgiN
MPDAESGEVRVLVYQQARDALELSAVQEAYDLVSGRMAGVPGMLGNELLRSAADPTALVVVSRWADMAAFKEWEQGPGPEADGPVRCLPGGSGLLTGRHRGRPRGTARDGLAVPLLASRASRAGRGRRVRVQWVSTP